jgi:riboflavin synthase
MFTGIIEEIGTVLDVNFEQPLDGLTVAARTVLEATRRGESIAVNGVCLTITSVSEDRFVAGVMPETLRRTNLGTLEVGNTVNLERALRADSRMGGHFVQGHVDGVGCVSSVRPDGSALDIRIEPPPELQRYIVEKGFIAVDGASLTVTSVDKTSFGIALIPYTQAHIAPGLQTAGHLANLEVDILAKYVEKLVVH